MSTKVYCRGEAPSNVLSFDACILKWCSIIVSSLSNLRMLFSSWSPLKLLVNIIKTDEIWRTASNSCNGFYCVYCTERDFDNNFTKSRVLTLSVCAVLNMYFVLSSFVAIFINTWNWQGGAEHASDASHVEPSAVSGVSFQHWKHFIHTREWPTLTRCSCDFLDSDSHL